MSLVGFVTYPVRIAIRYTLIALAILLGMASIYFFVEQDYTKFKHTKIGEVTFQDYCSHKWNTYIKSGSN